MIDLDAMFAAAKRRIEKRIEVAAQIALGRKPTTARRSAGQKFRQRGKTT